MKNITRKLVALSFIITGAIAIAPNQAQAQAEICYSGNVVPRPTDVIDECGDKEFSNFFSDLPISTFEVEINPAGDYEVFAEVEPSLGGPATYTLSYDVDIVGSSNSFLQVGLDSIVDPLRGQEVVTKEVTFAGAGSPIVLTSTSGNSDFANFPNGVTSISVLDTITIPARGSFDAVENDFNQVPEPMTILGSVAALGFGTVLKRQQKKKNG